MAIDNSTKFGVVKTTKDKISSSNMSEGKLYVTLDNSLGGGIYLKNDSSVYNVGIGNVYTKSEVDTKLSSITGSLSNKQDKLISGTNIKTINGESILGSGDIGNTSAYKIYEHGTNDTNITIEPNTFHVWDKVTLLSISLGSGSSSYANEYIFQFVSGTTATTLSLPSNIIWSNNSVPNVVPNKTYQISILNNLATFLEFGE